MIRAKTPQGKNDRSIPFFLLLPAIISVLFSMLVPYR